MSKTDWNESNLSDTDARLEAAASPSCQADNLKGLLNAIVSQISEADRRQSDTLSQLQDRLASMGRDAHSLRDKVPDKFQVAFERIEAGMAELATRISETGFAPSLSEAEPRALKSPAAFAAASDPEIPLSAPHQPASHPADATSAEPPVALRSATTGSSWRHEDSASKVASEAILHAYAADAGLDGVALRIFQAYGPFRRRRFLHAAHSRATPAR